MLDSLYSAQKIYTELTNICKMNDTISSATQTQNDAHFRELVHLHEYAFAVLASNLQITALPLRSPRVNSFWQMFL